jgi:UrcA family protein
MIIRTQRAVLARLCGVSLLATAGLAIAVPAAAQPFAPDPAGTPISVHVSYADLNLGTREGARAMLGRIDNAAKEACGDEPDVRLLSERAVYDRCKAQAEAQGVRDLNAPLVTAMAGPAAAIQLAQR